MPSVKQPKCSVCKKLAIQKKTFDLGSEGERTWLLCEFHCKQKIFNLYVKTQEIIDEKNQETYNV